MTTPFLYSLVYDIVTLTLFRIIPYSAAETPLNYSEIDQDVDNILKSAIGNIPVVRPDLPSPTFLPEKFDKIIERRSNGEHTPTVTPQVFTAKPTSKPPPNRQNFTAYIKKRVIERKYEYLLRRSTNYLMNLQNNVDEVDQIWKPDLRQQTASITLNYNAFWYYIDNFKKPKEKLRNAFIFRNYDNRGYPANTNGTIWAIEKNRTIAVMHNWVYRTRLNLLYSQRIKGKYLLAARYKLGYCFAMLRQLKREQLMLFNGYLYHWKFHHHLYYHLKVYEKIVRLDVDIKDLIKFIKILEKHRKESEQPEFYLDFELSTGTKWR